jgi:hypothetical protein
LFCYFLLFNAYFYRYKRKNRLNFLEKQLFDLKYIIFTVIPAKSQDDFFLNRMVSKSDRWDWKIGVAH